MQNREAMDRNEERTDRFIREKMIEAADRYEQELNSDPALQGLEPSPEVFENIMAEIRKTESAAQHESGTLDESAEDAQAMPPKLPDIESLLTEEDRMALELGRKQLRHRGRRRVLRAVGVAAALLVVVFGFSMISEANRIRLMDAVNTLVGKEGIVQLDNEENKVTINVDEREAREQIQKSLGIVPVEFMYLPNGIGFEGYMLDELAGIGQLFYSYGDTIFAVDMINKKIGSSLGVAHDGKVVESFSLDIGRCQVAVSEIEGPGELDYMAEFEYQNCYYTIYGILPREEFTKIIENMVFF